MKTCAVMLGALVAVGLSTSAMAGVIELEEVQLGSSSMPLAPGSDTITFDQFDTQGGTRTLVKVTMVVAGKIEANATAENDALIPAPDFSLDLSGFITVDLLGLSTFSTMAETFLTDGSITATDGVPGSGPDFWNFGHVEALGGDDDELSLPGDLSAFLGAGTIDANVFATGGFAVGGTTDSTLIFSNFMGTADVSLIYTYTEVPGPSALALLAGVAGLHRRRRRN